MPPSGPGDVVKPSQKGREELGVPDRGQEGLGGPSREPGEVGRPSRKRWEELKALLEGRMG